MVQRRAQFLPDDTDHWHISWGPDVGLFYDRHEMMGSDTKDRLAWAKRRVAEAEVSLARVTSRTSPHAPGSPGNIDLGPWRRSLDDAPAWLDELHQKLGPEGSAQRH